MDGDNGNGWVSHTVINAALTVKSLWHWAKYQETYRYFETLNSQVEIETTAKKEPHNSSVEHVGRKLTRVDDGRLIELLPKIPGCDLLLDRHRGGLLHRHRHRGSLRHGGDRLGLLHGSSDLWDGRVQRELQWPRHHTGVRVFVVRGEAFTIEVGHIGSVGAGERDGAVVHWGHAGGGGEEGPAGGGPRAARRGDLGQVGTFRAGQRDGALGERRRPAGAQRRGRLVGGGAAHCEAVMEGRGDRVRLPLTGNSRLPHCSAGLDLLFVGSQGEYNCTWRCPRPDLNPSGLVNNTSLAVGPQFTEVKIWKLTANVPAHYDTDFVYMRVYYGRYLRLNEE